MLQNFTLLPNMTFTLFAYCVKCLLIQKKHFSCLLHLEIRTSLDTSISLDLSNILRHFYFTYYPIRRLSRVSGNRGADVLNPATHQEMLSSRRAVTDSVLTHPLVLALNARGWIWNSMDVMFWNAKVYISNRILL